MATSRTTLAASDVPSPSTVVMGDGNGGRDVSPPPTGHQLAAAPQQPPFFANPFMAPFAPHLAPYAQHPLLNGSFDPSTALDPGPESSDSSKATCSSAYQFTEPYPPEAQAPPSSGAEFRVNPLTGGYFLSPHQYQEMMQQYVQGLMLAAGSSSVTGMGGAMADPQQDTAHSLVEPAPSMGPESLSSTFALLDVQSSSARADIQSPIRCNENSDSTNLSSTAPTDDMPVEEDSALPGIAEDLHDTTAVQENACNQVLQSQHTSEPSNVELNEGGTSEEKSVKNDPQAAESTAEEEPRQEKEESPAQEEQQQTAVEVRPSKEQDQRTSELIKKQINEIEREISRRIQNKNVKKMDETELAQLLSDHGFGNFVGFENQLENLGTSTNEAGLPYRPPAPSDDISESTKASLNQLRSSFSPPPPARDVQQQPQQAFASPPQQHSTAAMLNFGMTSTGGGMGLHGPAAFMTSPVMPQQGYQSDARQSTPPSNSHLDQQQQQQQHYFAGNGVPMNPPYVSASFANQPQHFYASNAMASPTSSPFYGAALQQHLPQQQFYGGGHQQQQQAFVNHPFASSNGVSASSGMVSGISPEMAAALLQQLQQQNPGLIENLVEQQQQNNRQATQQQQQQPKYNHHVHNGTAANASSTNSGHRNSSTIIPAPPMPNSNVSRRSNGVGGQSLNRRLSAGSGSSTTSKATTRSANLPTVPGSSITPTATEENGWIDISKRHGSLSHTSSQGSSTANVGHYSIAEETEDKENGPEPIWVMRDSYLKRLQREEQRNKEFLAAGNEEAGDSAVTHSISNGVNELMDNDELQETDKLLMKEGGECIEDGGKQNPIGAMPAKKSSTNKKEVMVHEPAVLIEGVLFRARYLGSTQLVCDGRPTKTSRMAQAQEAVARVKAPDGDQPSTEIDLFISTEKIMVLNTDLQRISETDVRQDILMDHSLRSISYIADIGDLVVLMARRVPQPTDPPISSGSDDEDMENIRKTPRVVCHVFESEEASFIAQSIGQAFQVAYVEFLRANGIDDPAYLREIDYQEVLNSQELMGEELEMFARKETQKDVVVPKKVGEALGIVVVESGWGSMLPTVVVANMAPGGPASRSNQLNIGDQIIAINGISLVGLPLASAQQNIKNAKTSTAVRLTIVSTPPVVEVRIKRPDTKYQLGFSVQNGVICSLLRGGIAERGGIRVGHRIIEINHLSVVAVPHERIVNMLATATGEIHMKTMPTSMFRLLTGQEVPNYI